jgi:hypothetical protein
MTGKVVLSQSAGNWLPVLDDLRTLRLELPRRGHCAAGTHSARLVGLGLPASLQLSKRVLRLGKIGLDPQRLL